MALQRSWEVRIHHRAASEATAWLWVEVGPPEIGRWIAYPARSLDDLQMSFVFWDAAQAGAFKTMWHGR